MVGKWIGIVFYISACSGAVGITNEPGLVFYSSFDRSLNADFHSMGDGQAGPVSFLPILPLTDKGYKGKAIVFAKDNLAEFKDVIDFSAWQPKDLEQLIATISKTGTCGLTYNVNGILNPEAGTIEMWVKPYFNQIEPYSIKSPNPCKQYYLMQCGSLVLVITSDGGLMTFFKVEQGPDEATCLQVNPLNWEPRTWHHIAFAWDKSRKALFVDKALKAESKLEGKLMIGNFLCLGSASSRDCNAQAVIDEVKIYNRFNCKN